MVKSGVACHKHIRYRICHKVGAALARLTGYLEIRKARYEAMLRGYAPVKPAAAACETADAACGNES